MKKFNKICRILVSLTAVAGIGCIIAAFVLGADPRQIRNHAAEKTSGRLQTQKLDIRADEIRKLDIDIGSANVKIQNGDQDQLIIKKKGSWDPVTLKSDGEIRIKNSIFRNSLIFQGLPPIKYQNLMYFPLFLPL